MPEERRPYVSPRRAQSAAETRAAILDSALELFAAQGYTRTSAAEIAGLAGVALKTVYLSVGSKPELVLALVDRGLEVPLGRWADAPPPPADLEPELLLDGLVARLRRVFEESLVVITVMGEAARADATVARRQDEVSARFRTVLATTARRLADRRRLRPGLGASSATAILDFYLRPLSWSALRGYGWSWSRIEKWLAERVREALVATGG